MIISNFQHFQLILSSIHFLKFVALSLKNYLDSKILITAGLEIFTIPDTIRVTGPLEAKKELLTGPELFLAKGEQLWEFLQKQPDTLKTD